MNLSQISVIWGKSTLHLEPRICFGRRFLGGSWDSCHQSIWSFTPSRNRSWSIILKNWDFGSGRKAVPEDSSCLSKSIPKTPDQGSCLIYIHASRMPRSWSPPLYGVNGRKVMLWQSCRVWVTAIPWRKTCQKTFLACIEVLSKRKWIGWTTFLLASCWLLHCLREKNKHGQWPTLFWTLGQFCLTNLDSRGQHSRAKHIHLQFHWSFRTRTL